MRGSQCLKLAFSILLVEILAFVGGGSSIVRADFEAMIARTPANANCLVLLNAEDIYKSPLAVKEKWKSQHEKGLAIGGFSLPPHVNRVVVASEVDIEFMQPTWNAAILELSQPPNVKRFAEKEHGLMDSIDGTTAVRLTGDLYAVQLDKFLVGIMAPANRQRVAQWLRYRAGSGGKSLSGYLQRAAGYAEDLHSEIVIALDAQNAVSRDLIRERLEPAGIVSQKSDLDKVTDVLANIEGVTLGVSVGERLVGKIRFDFTQDATILAPLAKPIFIHVLENNGAMISDFTTWKSTASGKTIYLEGPLSEGGLRRILSLVDLPTRDFASGSQAQTPDSTQSSQQPTESSLIVLSSKTYYNSVTTLIKDLRNERGNGNSWAIQGVWFDRYARKIDQLPLLNVDPELLDYGASVADGLRNGSLAVKGAGIAGSIRADNISPANYEGEGYYSSYYRGAYGGYGGVGYNSAYNNLKADNDAKIQAKREERSKGSAKIVGVMDQIDDATAQIRRTMTEKYKVEF